MKTSKQIAKEFLEGRQIFPMTDDQKEYLMKNLTSMIESLLDHTWERACHAQAVECELYVKEGKKALFAPKAKRPKSEQL